MTRYIDRNLLEHLIWRPGETITPPPPQPNHQNEPSLIEGTYILMPKTPTYAKGAHALREACKAETDSPHPQFVLDDESRIYRPLTFKEDIEARVTDYENNKDTEERVRLFQRNDSCTGIVYKSNTAKFKIVPLCKELITIDEDFREASVAVEYDAIEGIELDRAAGKYNVHLTKSEVLAHEGWRAAVEEDLELLKTYRDIVFTETKKAATMVFSVLDEPTPDQLKVLSTGYLSGNSDAYGSGDLSNGGHFLQVVPSGAPAGRGGV